MGAGGIPIGGQRFQKMTLTTQIRLGPRLGMYGASSACLLEDLMAWKLHKAIAVL
jgi:hypothetical protein